MLKGVLGEIVGKGHIVVLDLEFAVLGNENYFRFELGLAALIGICLP